MPQMRLDKLLSHLNCGSRKEVQALIRAGRVSVDGTVQKDPAFKVDPDQSQTAVDGTVQRYRAQSGTTCSTSRWALSRQAAMSATIPCSSCFRRAAARPVCGGKGLDKDTEGLLLITDDGALSHALMSPEPPCRKGV